MLWVETTTDEEAQALDRQIWDVATREEPDGTVISQAPGPAPENGEFWSHALDRMKDDPDQRYAMARRHLPLPAAWREMALALRMKIRQARKEKTGYEDLLRELHHLAAMSSYAGYSHIQRVPYARIAALDLSYNTVGTERLLLLGATDGKWMREMWGEPSQHSTAADLYKEMLAADLKRIEADKELEDEERTELLFGKLGLRTTVEEPQRQSADKPKSRGILGWLFGR